MFIRKDVTAVVLSSGEPTTQEAVHQLHRQTLPLYDILVVRNLTPFHKAINAGAAQVRTPFFVQVDADMILDPHCVATLRKNMRRGIGIVVGHLRDELMGQVVGVKLFRTSCFKDVNFQDSLSPDTDFVDDISRAGWDTIYVGPQGRGANPWPTLGEHRRAYDSLYTYQKYLVEGARYRYRQKPEGFRWHLGILETSRHPASLLAQIALSQGIFVAESRDLLGVEHGVAEFASIRDFLSAGSSGAASIDADFRTDLSLRELFGAYYRLGRALISANASSALERHMRALLNPANDERVLWSKIGLCRGLSRRSGITLEAAIELDGQFLHSFFHRLPVPFAESAKEDGGVDLDNDSSDLEAIANYVHGQGLNRFAIDAPEPAEYRTDHAARPLTCRKTGRTGQSMIDGTGRPRIKLPFKAFGHLICTQPERMNGMFWCFDLLRTGYAFVHLPTLVGPKKVWVAGQLAKNCLVRWGRSARESSAPSLRRAFGRLTRRRYSDYQPLPKRILMVTSTFARGGSERQMIAQAAALTQQGYDVRVMALWPLPPEEPSIEGEMTQLGLEPVLWSDFAEPEKKVGWSKCSVTASPEWLALPSWFMQKARAVELAIRQIEPSVVHGWLDLAGMVTAVTACNLGVPRVIFGQCSMAQHVRSYGAEAANLVWEGYQAIIRNSAVAIINNSVTAARSYERWLRFRAGTITVRPNCFWSQSMRFPTEAEIAESRATLGLPRRAPVVGTIMRLVPDKDPQLWVETAAAIASARADVHFFLAGSGPLREEVAEQIERLGLANRFVLPGAVTDIGLVHSLFDVFLLTSMVEGVPNVLVEAQAAGCAVVTTDVGGAKEAVLEGQTGLVVGGRSPAQLARAVLDILDDAAWRERARHAGPEFISQRFDGDDGVKQLLKIYGCSDQTAL